MKKTKPLSLKLYYELSEIFKVIAISFGISPKKGRKPKAYDWEIAAAFMIVYLTHTPVLKFFQMNIDPSIRSYHIFRSYRIKRVYKILRTYMQLRVIIMVLFGINRKLIVDGTILPIANVNRARTHKIKRLSGKVFWVKRRRKLYSPHYKKKIEFEEVYYGVLVMFLVDEEGYIYDIWFTVGSKHEIKALSQRLNKSIWNKFLLDNFEVIGDKGYRGLEYVKVSSDKKFKATRQMVETAIGGTKGFAYSRWRKGITLLTYLYGVALGFSCLRFINRNLHT